MFKRHEREEEESSNLVNILQSDIDKITRERFLLFLVNLFMFTAISFNIQYPFFVENFKNICAGRILAT